jgi:putative hydrolase of the HAD superfamily
MPVRAILFDLFGTLARFSPRRYREAVAEAARVLTAPPFDFAELWESVRAERETGMAGTLEESLQYVLRTLGVYTHLDQVRRAVDLLHDLEARIEPREGALEVLSELRGRGLKTGAVSNAVATTARRWPHTALAPMVDAAVFSCEAGVRQPDPRIYTMACDALGIAPHDCLFIGDGASGELSGAGAAGLRAVRIVDAREGPQEARVMDRAPWPGATIRSLDEVLKLVEPPVREA